MYTKFVWEGCMEKKGVLGVTVQSPLRDHYSSLSCLEIYEITTLWKSSPKNILVENISLFENMLVKLLHNRCSESLNIMFIPLENCPPWRQTRRTMCLGAPMRTVLRWHRWLLWPLHPQRGHPDILIFVLPFPLSGHPFTLSFSSSDQMREKRKHHQYKMELGQDILEESILSSSSHTLIFNLKSLCWRGQESRCLDFSDGDVSTKHFPGGSSP